MTTKKQITALGALTALSSSGAKKDNGNGDAIGAMIALCKIKPDPNQPRRIFDKDALNELAESIMKEGIIQPIVVRPDPKGNGYIIVAGERRWRAAKIAKLDKVPAITKEYDEVGLKLVQLAENVGRQDLAPTEVAAAVQQLKNEYGVKQEDAAKAIGMSKTRCNELVRAASARPEISGLLDEGVAVRAVVNLARAVDKDPEFVLDQVDSAKEAGEVIDIKFSERIINLITKAEQGENEAGEAGGDGVNELEGDEIGDTNLAGTKDLGQNNSEADAGAAVEDSDAEVEDQAPAVNDERAKLTEYLGGEFTGFKKRSAGKAEVSVEVPGRGIGNIVLEMAPKEPGQMMVAFSDGTIVAVEISEAKVVGFA